MSNSEKVWQTISNSVAMSCKNRRNLIAFDEVERKSNFVA